MEDEKIYNAILDELRENGPRQGLWAKCFAEANGNENAAKALYFKYRAQQLGDQESPTTVKSKSTDLAKHLAPNEKIAPSISQNNNGSLLALVLGIVICIGLWLLVESRKAENSNAADNQRVAMLKMEALTKEIAENNTNESKKKERFDNLYTTLPDFNFDKDWNNCKHISNTLSQAEFRSCVLDLLEVSNTRINDLKNKFILASNETSGNNLVSYAFEKHNEIQSTWCDTFIDLTWGQGNGVVAGVADCKITLNALLGKTLKTAAANYSNKNVMPASFSKNAHVNSHITCNDEDCLKQINLKSIEYQLKIKEYLNSKESSEKYVNLAESSRLIWLQSIEKTVINNLILSEHVCKKIASINQNQQILNNSTECEISLGLFWIDEFSRQYENFKRK